MRRYDFCFAIFLHSKVTVGVASNLARVASPLFLIMLTVIGIYSLHPLLLAPGFAGPPDLPQQQVTVRVSTSKQAYEVGETVRITVFVSATCNAIVTIFAPDGRQKVFDLGRLTAGTYVVTDTAGLPLGRRTVSLQATCESPGAVSGSAIATTFFEVIEPVTVTITTTTTVVSKSVETLGTTQTVTELISTRDRTGGQQELPSQPLPCIYIGSIPVFCGPLWGIILVLAGGLLGGAGVTWLATNLVLSRSNIYRKGGGPTTGGEARHKRKDGSIIAADFSKRKSSSIIAADYSKRQGGQITDDDSSESESLPESPPARAPKAREDVTDVKETVEDALEEVIEEKIEDVMEEVGEEAIGEKQKMCANCGRFGMVEGNCTGCGADEDACTCVSGGPADTENSKESKFRLDFKSGNK